MSAVRCFSFLRRSRKDNERVVCVLMSIMVAILLFVLTALQIKPVLADTTFVVNSTGDTGDASTADGRCDTDTATTGDQCSLRAAIQQANATTGKDTIAFNIPGGGVHRIAPFTGLPGISDPVIIDGYTQPGARPNTLVEGNDAVLLIELSGANDMRSLRGPALFLGTDNIVRGLAIFSFSGNYSGGIVVGGNGNVIEGCYIGVDASGERLSNANITDFGISVTSANNRIGGTAPAARNLIQGVRPAFANLDAIRGSVGLRGSGATGNVIQGNYISNSNLGITISNAPGNTIGGTVPGARNVVFAISSINGGNIDLVGRGTTGTLVQGNYLGTNIAGTAQVGFTSIGVRITDASSNTIGGTSPGARNIIAVGGAEIQISGSGAMHNVVQGNFIGTDVTGKFALSQGATGSGVQILSAPNNTIGGAVSGAGNLISGNGNGVAIIGATDTGIVTGTVIQGNLIGTDVTGAAPLAAMSSNSGGNSANGISVSNAANTVIGGEGGARNIIAYNPDDGIAVEGATGTHIRSNAIFNNGQLGIDLAPDGVTANDPGDGDSGANLLQNFPVLAAAPSATGGTMITGTVTSAPNRTVTVQLFGNAVADRSGFGEGQTLLQTLSVTTNMSGTAQFASEVPPNGDALQFVAATATDPNGNTSEFSNAVEVADPSRFEWSSPSYQGAEGASGVPVTVVRREGTDDTDTVNYATVSGTASAHSDYDVFFGTLTFAPGETTKNLSLPLLEDQFDEADETVELQLSNTVNGVVFSTSVVSITDNDPSPSLAVTDVVVVEGDISTTNAQFTISLSAVSGQSVRVDIVVADRTASGGSDYEPFNTTLTFNSGETSKTITVMVLGDTLAEGNETFAVVLSNPRNATLADAQGTGGIFDDDVQPTATVSPTDTAQRFKIFLPFVQR